MYIPNVNQMQMRDTNTYFPSQQQYNKKDI